MPVARTYQCAHPTRAAIIPHGLPQGIKLDTERAWTGGIRTVGEADTDLVEC